MANEVNVDISRIILSLSSLTFIIDQLSFSQWCISSIKSEVAYKKSMILCWGDSLFTVSISFSLD